MYVITPMIITAFVIKQLFQKHVTTNHVGEQQ